MNFKEIQELIRIIDRSKLAEFKLKEGEFEITIRSQKYYENKGVPSYAPAYNPAPSFNPASAQNQQTDPAPVSSKPAPSAESTAPAAVASGLLEIKSPMVGTFYRSPSPDKPPYLQVGDTVNQGSVVCIIEAMKLFNEIESDIKGKVVKIVVDDASPVEYDQVLFLVDPNA
jgi:acetyl-CoA carboxylase biotin carboxyl carrier protein